MCVLYNIYIYYIFIFIWILYDPLINDSKRHHFNCWKTKAYATAAVPAAPANLSRLRHEEMIRRWAVRSHVQFNSWHMQISWCLWPWGVKRNSPKNVACKSRMPEMGGDLWFLDFSRTLSLLGDCQPPSLWFFLRPKNASSRHKSGSGWKILILIFGSMATGRLRFVMQHLYNGPVPVWELKDIVSIWITTEVWILLTELIFPRTG